MGAINGRTRRHRRNRLAAEMYCTWTPRRLFTFGSSVGWAHWFDDPNDLYRRRNLATYTEQLNNAVWGTPGAAATVTADAATAPNGTSTADAVAFTDATAYRYQTVALPGGAAGGRTFTLSAWAWTLNGKTSVGIRIADAGAGSDTAHQTIALSATPTRVSVTKTFAAGTTQSSVIIGFENRSGFGGDGGTSGSVILWGIQLEEGPVATEYQPVPTTWEQAYLAAVGAERIFAWQDSAGTTPVTSVGQSVGLVLDRAYGGMRGAELATANYLTTAGYDNVTTVVGADAFTQTAGTTVGRTYLDLTTVAGKTYELISQITTNDAVGATAFARAGTGGGGTILATSNTVTSSGTQRLIFTATGAASTILWTTTAVAKVVSASGISIREVPGVHRIQATSASRPLLMARVNIQGSTELLSTAAWSKVNATATDNAATAPDGTTTASRLVENTATGVHSIGGGSLVKPTAAIQYVWDLWLQPNGRNYASLQLQDGINSATQYLNLSTGQLGTYTTGGSGFSIQSTTLVESVGTWRHYRVAATSTTGAIIVGIVYIGSALNNVSYTGDGASGINIWHPDIRTADDAAKNIPSYQRVGATAADHDTAGYPMCLLYDGTDDSYASTATVDGSGSDKVTVVTGVTKNSDSPTYGTVLEFTSSSNTIDGSFAVFAPAAASTYAGYSRGTVNEAFDQTAAIYSGPHSAIIGFSADNGAVTAADQRILRINGVEHTTGGATSAGNYANATCFFGRRTGTTLPFNGREYASIGRFGPMSETERNRLEQWTKNLMRMP